MRISDWSSDVCSSDLRPDLRLLLVEQGDTLGGNHTWSFHQHDLTPAQHRWLEPMVSKHWPGYEVIFPDLQRRLGRSEEHTSELQSLMRISYAVFCLKKKNKPQTNTTTNECTIIYTTNRVNRSMKNHRHKASQL